MSEKNLLKHTRVSQLTTARSVAFTTRRSKVVDMQGFEGVMFIVQGSTLLIVSSTAKVYAQGADSTTASFLNYKGGSTAWASTAAGVNYRNAVLDVYRPHDRYVRCCITGNSSVASNVNSILAIQYGARHSGSTHLHDSTTLAGTAVIIGATS